MTEPRKIPVVMWATEEQLDTLVAQVRERLEKPEADLITLAVFEATHRKPVEEPFEAWVNEGYSTMSRGKFYPARRVLVVP